MTEARRIVDGLRARGYGGRIVHDTYICDECSEVQTWVGVVPDNAVLSYCPSCGESAPNIMLKVLVVGDPIVLSER